MILPVIKFIRRTVSITICCWLRLISLYLSIPHPTKVSTAYLSGFHRVLHDGISWSFPFIEIIFFSCICVFWGLSHPHAFWINPLTSHRYYNAHGIFEISFLKSWSFPFLQAISYAFIRVFQELSPPDFIWSKPPNISYLYQCLWNPLLLVCLFFLDTFHKVFIFILGLLIELSECSVFSYSFKFLIRHLLFWVRSLRLSSCNAYSGTFHYACTEILLKTCNKKTTEEDISTLVAKFT